MTRALIVVVGLSLIGGCGDRAPEAPCAVATVATERDSARAAVARLELQVDSLMATVRVSRGLVAGAQQAMLRYARIVQRDPGQSRFLVTWTRRAFDGVAPP